MKLKIFFLTLIALLMFSSVSFAYDITAPESKLDMTYAKDDYNEIGELKITKTAADDDSDSVSNFADNTKIYVRASYNGLFTNASDSSKVEYKLVYGENKGVMTVAEESTAWPMVSRPTTMGGLGFGYKWNMGWMNDTLKYISHEPVHRKYHHGMLTFGLLYAFNENFILPISHDEVVHGKGSMLSKMPGDEWQKFANLRAYYGFMWTHPGKQLLFMGSEFGQDWEWNSGESLRWHLLEYPMYKGMQNCVRDLNLMYQGNSALYEEDFDYKGFEWIDHSNADDSVISFIRKGHNSDNYLIVICNFTPVVRHHYRVGVFEPCKYQEIFNSDDPSYFGSGVKNEGQMYISMQGWNSKPYSIEVTLPPLSTIVIKPVR